MQKGKGLLVLEILLLGLSVFLVIGVETAFSACGPMEDGSYMSCHWAQQAVFGLGIVLAIEAAGALLLKNRGLTAGISLAMIPTAILTAAVPGGLIRLCVMPGMHCRVMLRPFAIGVAAAIAVLAAVHTLAAARKRS